MQAGFETYWWHPLVDDPTKPGSSHARFTVSSLSRASPPAGTVGTKGWMFALQILRPRTLAVAGMDLGYYPDLPMDKSQTYYELLEIAGSEERVKDYYTSMTFPLTGETFMTGSHLLLVPQEFPCILAKRAPMRTLNCTEAGTLFGENIDCVTLDHFLNLAEKDIHG